MDFHDSEERERFRQELRQWLAAHLSPDLCVDDPTDERVAPDRETFERRVAWQRTMFNRVISARQYTLAGGTSEIQRNIIGERVLGLPKD